MVPGNREATVPPQENREGWGDSTEHSQRRAAHVGGSHASAYEKNLSTLAISFLPRMLEIFRFELRIESEISPILFACFPALISGCFLDLYGK